MCFGLNPMSWNRNYCRAGVNIQAMRRRLNPSHVPIARASLHDFNVDDTKEGHSYFRRIPKSPFVSLERYRGGGARDVADVKAGAEDKSLWRQLMTSAGISAVRRGIS